MGLGANQIWGDMKFRFYGTLFLIGVIISLGVAALEKEPGYMDADYYYASGLRIASNQGWDEPFLWNYLDDPQGLPHPAFTYWMPLAGIVAGLSMKITGISNFWGARIGFLIIAGCIGPLTAYLAYTFTPNRWAAILAGSIAIFAGFYYAYLPTTETFGIYMILGGIFFILVKRLQNDRNNALRNPIIATDKTKWIFNFWHALISPFWIYLLVGAITGLMYMTRADGLIWLLMALIVILVQGRSIKMAEKGIRSNRYQFWSAILLCLVGFFIVSSPWVLRNLSEFGSVFAPGSSRAIWLTVYDDLYLYPASQLTFDRWMNTGIIEMVKTRGWALGLNLLNAFAVQGGIFLLPLMIGGMWVNRKDWRVSFGLLTWFVIFLTMTVVFPYQGARGGFFHAGAALQPLLWALVPAGLVAFIGWGERSRKWDAGRALKVFGYGSVGLVIVITFFVTWQRLGREVLIDPGWGKTERMYQLVEEHLVKLDASPDTIVMVNNPPGYYGMTGREAIVIPHGDIAISLQVGKKYDAGYLILDENYPEGLGDFYSNPGDQPGLKFLDSIEQMHIYKFER